MLVNQRNQSMPKSCFFFKKPKPVTEKQNQVQNPVHVQFDPEPDWPRSEPIDIPEPKNALNRQNS